MALHRSRPQQAVLTRAGLADEYADLLGLDRRGEQLTPEQRTNLQKFKARADDIHDAKGKDAAFFRLLVSKEGFDRRADSCVYVERI